jgi:hypothetical protein
MIPGAKLRVAPKLCFRKMWREMVVLFEICFEVILDKSGLIFKQKFENQATNGNLYRIPISNKAEKSLATTLAWLLTPKGHPPEGWN